MAKITIQSITSGFRSTTALDTNFQAIATELNDKVLYRDNPVGEDNAMQNDFDMNSFSIINLPIATAPTEAVRFSQISSLIAGSSIPTQEEGTTVVQTPSAMNFVGDGVTVTAVGGDVSTITIPSPTTPIQEEGSLVIAVPSALNFVGAGVTATDVGGVATVTVPFAFIPVEAEGSSVVASPTALNFVGSGVTVTDVSDVATVTIELGIPTEQTGTTYTTVLTDANSLVRISNASANTITIPPNSSVAYPIGAIISIVQTGAGTTTLAPGAGVTINSADSLLDCRAQYSTVSLMKILTDTWILTGDLA